MVPVFVSCIMPSTSLSPLTKVHFSGFKILSFNPKDFSGFKILSFMKVSNTFYDFGIKFSYLKDVNVDVNDRK